jgi:hypothetical protein
MRRVRTFGFVLSWLMACVPTACAATIFSTFHPELGVPNQGKGIAIFHGDIGEYTLGYADQIDISGGTYQSDSLTVALFPLGLGNTATFAILADANGSPGPVVDSFSINGVHNGQVFYAANSTLHPLLLDGGVYWIAGFVPSADQDIAWAFYSGAPARVVASGPFHDGSWQVFTSGETIFTLEGTLVAEPRLDLATMTLLAWLVISARRHHHGDAHRRERSPGSEI